MDVNDIPESIERKEEKRKERKGREGKENGPATGHKSIQQAYISIYQISEQTECFCKWLCLYN